MAEVVTVKTARIVGWRRALATALRIAELRDWAERIWFCHHNARVIADFEYRMACVLTHCTRGMSKPYYTAEAMQAEIADYFEQYADEAIDDWCKDHGVDRAKAEAAE